jgi:fructokinase
VELGGTKCICILGTGLHDVRARIQVPTGEPSQTLARVEEILDDWRAEYGPFAALGIASFGPLAARQGSSEPGRIAATSKPGWSNTDVAGRLGGCLGVPVGFATDVEGAALAEGRWGGAQGLDDFAYVTVGTGVGVGLIVGGGRAGGFGHPELGHIRVVRMPGDHWPGSCPFHGDCLEGLICGPSIAARTGLPAEQLPADHPVWEAVAFALGQLLHVLVLATAPRRVLIGGGVVQARPYLLERARAALRSSLAGYRYARELEDLESYVAPPGLGALAGPLGALALAAEAASTHGRAR